MCSCARPPGRRCTSRPFAAIEVRNEPYALFDPDISPDGRRIAFAAPTGLFEVDVRTRRLRRLVTAPKRLGLRWPRYSPDGRSLAYAHGLGGAESRIVRVLSLERGAPQTVARGMVTPTRPPLRP